jgi:hypothetical protein
LYLFTATSTFEKKRWLTYAFAKGRAEEAIELLERALEIQIRIGGAENPTVQKLSDHLCDVLNGCALKHLQNGAAFII